MRSRLKVSHTQTSVPCGTLNNPDPVFYREVDMSDLPSLYAEEVETFRHILDLPDPRETMPRSSTTVLGLDDQKG